MNKVNQVGSKISSKVSSFVGSQNKNIQMVLVVLILLNFAPYDFLDYFSDGLGKKVKDMLGVLANPVQSIMSHVLARTFLFIALIVSCCSIKNMNLFFLLSIYFIMVSR